MTGHGPFRPTLEGRRNDKIFWRRLLRHVGSSVRVVQRPQRDPRLLQIYDFDFSDDDDEMGYEQLLALQQRIGSVTLALPPQTLAALPTIKFKIQPPENKAETGERCTVCLEGYKDGERVLQFPCFHIFHGHCVTNWFNISKFCPICRTSKFTNSRYSRN